MSDKQGYEGRANAELFKIEYKPFEAKDGTKYETYKLTCILKELWDADLEEYTKYDDKDDFNADSYNVFGEYTLWLGNRVNEKTGKTSTQMARETIQKVFDIEIKEPEDFFPNVLMDNIKNKRLNVVCSIRDEKYTKIDFINNIDGKAPAKKITDDEKSSIADVLKASW
jgi:hypothetical protein